MLAVIVVFSGGGGAVMNPLWLRCTTNCQTTSLHEKWLVHVHATVKMLVMRGEAEDNIEEGGGIGGCRQKTFDGLKHHVAAGEWTLVSTGATPSPMPTSPSLR